MRQSSWSLGELNWTHKNDWVLVVEGFSVSLVQGPGAECQKMSSKSAENEAREQLIAGFGGFSVTYNVQMEIRYFPESSALIPRSIMGSPICPVLSRRSSCTRSHQTGLRADAVLLHCLSAIRCWTNLCALQPFSQRLMWDWVLQCWKLKVVCPTGTVDRWVPWFSLQADPQGSRCLVLWFCWQRPLLNASSFSRFLILLFGDGRK